jgi:hypothetical protein
MSKAKKSTPLNPVEFDGIGMQTGLNSFILAPKTRAVGITRRSLRGHQMRTLLAANNVKRLK